jgi:hypothetical protein
MTRDPIFGLEYVSRDDDLICIWPLSLPPSDREYDSIRLMSGPCERALSPIQVLACMDAKGEA